MLGANNVVKLKKATITAFLGEEKMWKKSPTASVYASIHLLRGCLEQWARDGEQVHTVAAVPWTITSIYRELELLGQQAP